MLRTSDLKVNAFNDANIEGDTTVSIDVAVTKITLADPKSTQSPAIPSKNAKPNQTEMKDSNKSALVAKSMFVSEGNPIPRVAEVCSGIRVEGSGHKFNVNVIENDIHIDSTLSP